MFKDVQHFVTSCDECQRAGNISWRHETPQTGILEVELFDVWGIDFMGYIRALQVHLGRGRLRVEMGGGYSHKDQRFKGCC